MASGGQFVFISHCTADQEEAGRIVGHYERDGIRFWWGPRDLRQDQDLNAQVNWAIQNSSAVLVVASDQCRASMAVRAEADQAARTGKPIFLVRMADVYLSSDIPALGGARLTIDAFGPNAQANVGRLTQELQALVRGPAPQPGGGWAPTPGGQPGYGAGAGGPPPYPGQPGPAHPPPTGGPIDGGQEPMLRAYVRDNADYYLGKWRQMDARRSRTSFNFAAFFLNALWLIYRKMWGLGLGILGGILLVNLVVLAISPVLAPFISLLSIGVAIWVGLMGNAMYRRQAERAVAQAAAMHPDPHSRMSHLARRGGTSVGAAIGVAVAASIVNVIAMLVVLGTSGAFDQAATAGGGGSTATTSNESGTSMAGAPASNRERLIGRWGVTCRANDIGLVFNDDGTMRLGDGGARWEVVGERININHDDGEFEMLTIRSLTDDELRFTSNADPQVDMVRRCN